MKDSFYYICILLSSIDRAGVPVAMISGLVWSVEKGYSAELFTGLCMISGLLGDMTMYYIGRGLTIKSNMVRKQKIKITVTDKVAYAISMLNKSPWVWLLFGRAFQLINQFIPLAAGIRRISPLYVMFWCTIGNIIWFGIFAIATKYIGYQLIQNNRIITIVGIVISIVIILICWYKIQDKFISKISISKDRKQW